VPSVFNPSKFKCYTDLEKALVVSGMILTVLSSLFSVYKLRIAVRENVKKLHAAGIKPTLKRIAFVERALAHHQKTRLMLPMTERPRSHEEINLCNELEAASMP
jgi:hypothetical protein